MLIVAVLVAVFTVGYAFAWFVERKDSDFKLTGASAGAYFDGTSGDGTSAEFVEGTSKGPFIIANSTHMRNLAVLQNTGRFGENKYYFKIKDSVEVLDMSALWLPPIGTDDNPFIGEFDGNGKTIANLKVTTDKALLTEKMYPTQAKDIYDKFSQAVGLFGNTGASSNIRNFILHNPHVVVGTPGVNNNKYSTALAKTVGIAVGHVAGKCSSIGVRATDAGKNTADGVGSTTLDVRDTGYSTFNSILGELDEGVESSVTGGGHVPGGSIGYGTSTDIEELKSKMQLLNGTTGTPSIDAGQYLPFDGTGEIVTEGGKNIGEVASNNNIGYYTGNDIKIYEKNKSDIDSNRFYYPSGASNVIYTLPYTAVDYNNPDNSKLYPDADDGVKKATINSDDTKIYTIRLQNKIDINNNLTTIYNAKVWGEDISVLKIPRRVVWVKPKQAGTMKFVMINTGDGENFTLSRFYRTVKGDYSSAMTGLETLIDTNNLGMLTYGKSGADIRVDGQQVAMNDVALAYYFTWEITDEDIAAGYEFALSRDNGSNGAYFWYLDIGANGGNTNVGKVDDTVQVSAVDFIYDGVEIEQEDATIGVGNFIVDVSGVKKLYNASMTSVYFDSLKAMLKVVYVRLNEETGKHSGKTICLENSDEEFDTTSEVKATYATYVCPTIGGGSGTGSGSGGGGGGGETVAVSSVSIADAPATMTVGGTANLTANVLPSNATNKTVSWSSSDTSIATVDSSGKVTAKAAGTVTITATAGGKSKSVTITVTGGVTQYHSGTYTLNANSTDDMVTNNGATVSGSTWVLGANAQTVNLALNVQSGKVITISVKGKRNSDKAEGINVYLGESNSGTLLGTIDLTSTEAEGIGTVQYTATADGYVYLALGRSAGGGTTLSEITVTISDDSGTVTPTVSGVTVTPATATVKKDETTTLSANVTMSDGSAYSGSVVWTSSDTSIATVSNNGVVTGVAKGTVTITATAGGKSNTCTVTVTDSSTSTGGTNLISSIGSDTISKNVDIFGGSNDNLTVTIDNSSIKTTLSSPVVVDGVTYTDAFISNSNGAKVFTITAKKATTVTVYYCTTSNGEIYTAKPTLSGGTEQTTSLDNVYKVEATLQADGTLTITGASNCRISILAIYIS